MLQQNISDFLSYCKTSNFSESSLETLSSQLREFAKFVQARAIAPFQQITYRLLTEFVTDFKTPSVHVQKQRVWTLHQFFHFLKAHHLIEKNIALEIPYPKITKKVPFYLTIDEFNRLLEYAIHRAYHLMGLRDLLIIMILGFLGLRLKALIGLDIQDVNLKTSTLFVSEKGNRKRQMCMPQVLCAILAKYFEMLEAKDGPLFLSKRRERISERTVQLIFQQAMTNLGIDKHLHAHLFRHTAGTHLNKVAGPVITQFVLGHARRKSTEVYTHLNPDQYALYMQQHPYMSL